MKTAKLQMNAKDFKATRDIISAYFGAKYELAEELDKTRKATKSIADVITTDEEQLLKVLMGNTEGIIRDRATIEESIRVNKATYEKLVAPYNAMVEATSKAIADAVALFANKDSVLYKAYVAYVTDTTDDNYNAYADAMASRFVELGLKDATADNVAHFMPNADRELRGTTAVKKQAIQGAVNPSAFANAVLRKIYVADKDKFASAKFTAYCRKCAEKAKK